MSICTQETSHQSMINRHGVNLLEGVSQTLRIWRDRIRTRQELTHWSQRDMHDAGISWSEMVAEAEKPFWRA